MIKPTDEMVNLLVDAAKSYDEWKPTPFWDLMHGALVDVLAIVERDYDVKRKVCGNRGFAGASGCWRELGHEGNHLWSRGGTP